MVHSSRLYSESHDGMAVAPHAAAADAGAAVLADGGNAIEACVAMAATLAAVYPHMSGLGGDSFWLLHAPGGAVKSVLGCGRSGAAVEPRSYLEDGLSTIPYRGGKAAITVAGTVSAWEQVLDLSAREWGGRLPLPRLLADAITYCREGYQVSASQSVATTDKFEQLESVPGFAEVFLSEGRPPAPGITLKQPALAETLERLAKAGLQDFYSGELGHCIARELKNVASPLTLGDLRDHRAVFAQPLQMRVGDALVYTTPPPTQGLATLLILGQFAHRPIDIASSEDVDMIHWLVEATKQAFAVRNREVRDPGLMRTPAEQLLDPARLQALRQGIDGEQAAIWGEATSPADTTWFGAIDAAGYSVSCIQSLYHEFGSGVVLPESGLCWQNRGAIFSLAPGDPWELGPRRLPFHTLCPSMAHFDNGRRMVFGTMGGDGQPQTQSILFTRYATYGQPLAQAVSAPRWVLGRTWGDHSNNLKMESRFEPAWVDRLRARGHDIVLLDAYDETVGHAGAIVRNESGRIQGASDPRSDGAAVAADRG